MTWSWTNKTAYDDEGLQHLVERIVQSSQQMHVSDPYEDREPVDVQSVLVDYSDSGGIMVNLEQTDLLICLPHPTKLWPELEAIEVLAGQEEATIPRDVIEEVGTITLAKITDNLAVYRAMQKLYRVDAIADVTRLSNMSPWHRDVLAPCKVTINKEAL